MNALEEFQALKLKFPRLCQNGRGNDNCDWSDNLKDSSNCYWSFDGAEVRDCLYSYYDWQVTNSIDTQWSAISERCYELTDSINSSDCYFCRYLARCYNMQYCYMCTDSHDCFGCVLLNNKEYCIFNIQHTEEEYKRKFPELKKMAPDEVMAKVADLTLKFPKIQSFFGENENSEYVDYVYKSNNAYYCFDCNTLEDCGYLSNANECKDSWDSTLVIGVEHCCEAIDSFDCYNSYGIQNSVRCYDSSYLYNCTDCNSCFMCVNLANAKYCILNIQYTPAEYKAKVAEIKRDLGLNYTDPAQA